MLIEAMLLIGVCFAAFVLFLGVMRFLRMRRLLVEAKRETERRCLCGYRLEKLEIPRCPECGRLAGFKSLTLADLGLTEEQAQANVAARRKPLTPPEGDSEHASA